MLREDDKMKTRLRPPYSVFFGTLANQNRLDIISLLLKGPVNAKKICEKLGFNQPTASKNLQRLERCGFVFVRHKGNECIYTLNKDTIEPIIKLMNAHTKNYCSKLPECRHLPEKQR